MPDPDSIYKAAIFIWPPKSTDPVVVRNWKIRLVLAYYVGAAVYVLTILWILGIFSLVGVPSPVFAGDLDNLRNELQTAINSEGKALRLGQLIPQLDEARVRHCLVLRAGEQGTANQSMLDSALGKLRDLEVQYWQLAGRAYAREDCSAVIIPGGVTQ